MDSGKRLLLMLMLMVVILVCIVHNDALMYSS